MKSRSSSTAAVDAAHAALARETLRSSLNLAALGSLMRAFAHDGNNRLMVIMSCLEVLSLDTLDATERREALALATGAAHHLADDLNALLTGARAQLAHPRRIDLVATLRTAIELYGFMSPGSTAVALSASAPAWVQADPTQLQPALLRLLLAAERLGTTDIAVSVATVDSTELLDELPQLRKGRYAAIDCLCVGATLPQRLVRDGPVRGPILRLLCDPDGLEFAAVEAYAQSMRGALHVRQASARQRYPHPRIRLLLPLPPQD